MVETSGFDMVAVVCSSPVESSSDMSDESLDNSEMEEVSERVSASIGES